MAADVLFVLLCLRELTTVFSYAVPQPIIEIYNPKGLKVSIPHDDGIELFAFHGNVTSGSFPDVQTGQVSQEVRKKTGDSWIVEDEDVVVKPGDRIRYWLFVIRQGLGYRKENGMFVVKGSLQVVINLTQSNIPA